MSGHNKWSQIKRKKDVEDRKKSKIFSVLVRDITLAAKESGGNKNSPVLKSAIEKAKGANMPNENIERAIAKGSGAGGVSYESVTYEAYCPGGAAIIVEGTTDSRNRTNNEIKHILSEHGATLGTPGSAAWAFDKTNEGWKAKTKMTLAPEDKEKLDDLVSDLEEYEDVESVVSNAEEDASAGN